MSESSRLERVVVAVFAAFAFLNAILWAVVIPPGDAPDEPGHFEVVAFEAAFGRIPEFGVDDYGTTERIAIDGYRSPLNTYSAQPGLSYLVSAAAIRLFGPGLDDPAIAARFPGALWAALMTLVVFVGIRAIFPGETGVAVLGATVSAFWPQLAFLFSYINNDGLTTLASACLITCWFVGRNHGWRVGDAVMLGAASGLVLLNKPNGFPLVAIGGVIFLAGLGGHWRERAARLAAAAGAALVTCGWWYAIAFRRYGWDLLAGGRAEKLREEIGVEWASGRFYGRSLIETALDPFPRFGETWIAGTLRTAVGAFGELTIALPGWSYATVAAVTIAALGGFFVSRVKSRGARLSGVHVVTFLLIPLFLGLSLYRSWAHDFQAQGRYLFPAMLPFLAVVAAGLLTPFRPRWRALAGALASLMFIAIFIDAFSIRLLGAYRLTVSDLAGRSPGLVWGWGVLLVAGTGAAILYWLRLGGISDASLERPRTGSSAAE